MFKIQIRSPGGLDNKSNTTFDASWKILKDAIKLIFDGRVSELSFQTLFHAVYCITLRRQGEKLYEELHHTIERRLQDITRTHLHSESESYLRDILSIWYNHCESLRLISNVTMYLDKVYCKENRKPPIYHMGLDLFRDIILKSSKDQLQDLMIQNINAARSKASQVDFDSLRSLVEMMETITDEDSTYYATEFEPFLLHETQEYYRSHAKYYSGDLTAYPQEVESLLCGERRLDAKFLNSDVSIKIAKVVEEIMISENIHIVAMEVVPEILRTEQYSSLRLLFGQCQIQNDRKKLWKQCSQYIVGEGLAIAEDLNLKKKTQVAVKWMQEMIALKEKYEVVFKSQEDDDLNGLQAVNEALSVCFNQNSRKTAENLAIYLDSMLRAPSTSEESFKKHIDDCIAVFKLLKDKDFFEKLYQQQMSKRLLQQRSSLKFEKMFVNRMREEVGAVFAQKPDGMFRDIALSQTNNTRFHQAYHVPVEYEMNVLTPTCWPFQQMSNEEDVVLPSALEALKLDFENHYMKTYSGRVLKWAYHLGSMDIGIQFSKSYHIITMPVFAAIILMLFEDYVELTAQEIGDLTHIEEKELIRNLLTIAVAPKTRLLKKQPMNKKILPSDKFRLNYSFSAPSTKVKVLAVLSKQDSDSQGVMRTNNTLHDVAMERQGCTEAAVVRLMKGASKMYCDMLFEETRKILCHRFDVTPDLFQASLERLVEREYLQRDSEESSFYHYLP
ncbi:LADA_0C04698g1_1 [Lachancea dasiensis]|uniref:LADA_0C04698g1_1 n=1 Tax=Lachancea dasiensis TaxID=1072105 RepID=A0A1G4IYR0_9SACH|nr:LADA_0C04698g1_1 [Lachancea dasiensis]